MAGYVSQMIPMSAMADQVLKWAGLAAIAAGIIVALVGNRLDRPVKESNVDMDALMEKYLNEEKHESFFE